MPTAWNRYFTDGPQRAPLKGQPNRQNTVAVCRYYKHFGNLSADMLREHECLRKQCPHLRKIEEHPYWRAREKKKLLKAGTKREQLAADYLRSHQSGRKFSDSTHYHRPDAPSASDVKTVVPGATIGMSFAEALADVAFTPAVEAFAIYAVNYKDGSISLFRSNGAVTEKSARSLLIKGYRVHGSPYAAIVPLSSEDGSLLLFRFSKEANHYVEVDPAWGTLYPRIAAKLTKKHIIA